MSNPRSNDIGIQTLRHMLQRGIATMPRNYELFYEAFSGNDPELVQAVAALPKLPTQRDIDELLDEHLPSRRAKRQFAEAYNRLLEQMNNFTAVMTSEDADLKKLTGSMNQAVSAISGIKDDEINPQAFKRMASSVSQALETKIVGNDSRRLSLSENEREIEELRRKVESWRRLAVTDQLTQLANRRAFDDTLNTLYDLPRPERFTLFLVDIDKFKHINDTFGHAFGDKVLQQLAVVLREVLPSDCFICRQGGEEFAAIVSEADAERIALMTERVRRAIEQADFIYPKTRNRVPVTISMGVCMARDAHTSQALFDRADKALYRSKNEGRNRVTFHGQDPSPERMRTDAGLAGRTRTANGG